MILARRPAITCIVLAACTAINWTAHARQQQTPPRFGGAYAGLGERRQHLVNDWVSRFVKTTGQTIEPGPFYDDIIHLSTKTTFEAVTHALMTTAMTDSSGASLGDGLTVIQRLDAVRGEIAGSRGDSQFRIYARLVPGAVDTLSHSQEFKREADNSVFHKGYPINFRARGGTPSIQISIAVDRQRADIDVDYRSSAFPVALFNGHLSSSNSDVRAGNNYDKHLNRWTGFQNWWRGFFGVRQDEVPESLDASKSARLPKTPRVGAKDIDVMVNDFLTAWLVEGNVIAAMGYVSDRSWACLAQDGDNPAEFDRGMAPFELMANLKAAHDSLGPQTTLKGLVVGTRLSRPGLRVVQQPHHAQFVVYEVPDDIAAAFDCESRLTPGDAKTIKRSYGNYFGSTFFVAGRRDVPVALLWGKQDGYWKIVSWQTGAEEDSSAPALDPVAAPNIMRIPAEASLVQAAHDFFESWLIRKNYDAAFAYLSPSSYGCYAVEHRDAPGAITNPDLAGRSLRAALAAFGDGIPAARTLDGLIEAAEPVHPAIRVMNHAYSRLFSLSSLPDALADATECAARANGNPIPDPLPLEYGNGFGTTIRFKTRSGDPPVLRLLWRKEAGAWRIASYAVELP